jgi:hypothetical protein
MSWGGRKNELWWRWRKGDKIWISFDCAAGCFAALVSIAESCCSAASGISTSSIPVSSMTTSAVLLLDPRRMRHKVGWTFTDGVESYFRCSY